MQRTLVLIVGLALVAVATYAAAPLVAAWQIREAVRSGDRATLAQRVDWPSVRQSLKASLGEARQALEELAQAAGEPRPGFWARLRQAAFPYVVDPLIERYVTADGVPRLYAWRQAWRQRVEAAGGAVRRTPVLDEPRPAAGPLDRTLAAWRRVERWSFTSPTRVEIDVADRVRTERVWRAVLEMRGLRWQLTEMRVMRSARPPRRLGDMRLAGQR